MSEENVVYDRSIYIRFYNKEFGYLSYIFECYANSLMCKNNMNNAILINAYSVLYDGLKVFKKSDLIELMSSYIKEGDGKKEYFELKFDFWIEFYEENNFKNLNHIKLV